MPASRRWPIAPAAPPTLRDALRALGASYERRLRRIALRSPVAHRCATEVRDAILAPVLGIMERNPDFGDRDLAHLLRVRLGQRRAHPPALGPDATPADLRALQRAWVVELRRVRACLPPARR